LSSRPSSPSRPRFSILGVLFSIEQDYLLSSSV